MLRRLRPSLVICLSAAPLLFAQTREEKVRADRRKFEADGSWIYNDLGRGIADAKKTGKPILAVLRCIPCEECVKLDDDLVNEDPRLGPLLEKFVRVRLISTNGLDLGLFQFDYDQSFAAFVLNGDGTIYGRFGTRSHRTAWADDVSVEGLARALEGALALHAAYPKNKAELAGRKGPPPAYPSPEQYPLLKGRYGPNLDVQGKVVASCIHCHQIGDAQRQLYRDRKEPMPDRLLFSYPHPKAVGLILDPKERATVLRVQKDSAAARAGFQKADVILKLAGQPLLSIADVQWVLHQASPEGAELKAHIERVGQRMDLTLSLPKGWRQRDDLSWRASTWGLRRMALGGLVLEELGSAERSKLGIGETSMALRVKHVGQYGPHAAARDAGFRQGDIILAFDGQTEIRRETDVLAYALRRCQPGERVPLTVLRDGREMTLTMPMQR